MPWNISSLLKARERFIHLVKDLHLPVAQACRRQGISRKTGFKFLRRFHERGRLGLRELSHRPQTFPGATFARWEKIILRLREKHPHWGGQKLYQYLRRRQPYKRLPRARTIQHRLKLLGRAKKRLPKARKGPALSRAGLTRARHPNHVWTLDFKGWVRTADGVRQEPLTVRDLFSRYGLCIRLLSRQEDGAVRRVLRGLFKRHGLPQIIRVDNGSPFAGKGALGLSRLSVWWLRLGIRVQFTRRARPGDNAAHEQFHGCYQREVIEAAKAADRRQLQGRSNRWLALYNRQRPHAALKGKTPADRYRPQPRKYSGEPPVLNYPPGWEERTVRNRGNIKWRGRLRNIGRAFVGQRIGLRQTKKSSPLWRVYLGSQLIGELHQQDATGLRPAKRHWSAHKKA
jgi:transposase InsO family protein